MRASPLRMSRFAVRLRPERLPSGPGSVLVTPIGYETDDVTYTPQSSNFSLVLQPFEPYYFVMTLDWQSVPKADQGLYTLVLDETVDGQPFVSHLQIDAVPFQPQ